MTLVLSVATPGYVIQASDRKVVSVDRDGQIRREEDERNKAIFVAERLCFAYTGHADIGGSDTAEFFQGRVASTLAAGGSAEQALDGVAEMLSQYFASLPPERDRHHAFVGAGWTDETLFAQRTPCLITLTNSLPEGAGAVASRDSPDCWPAANRCSGTPRRKRSERASSAQGAPSACTRRAIRRDPQRGGRMRSGGCSRAVPAGA